jgi:hypothetical protein
VLKVAEWGQARPYSSRGVSRRRVYGDALPHGSLVAPFIPFSGATKSARALSESLTAALDQLQHANRGVIELMREVQRTQEHFRREIQNPKYRIDPPPALVGALRLNGDLGSIAPDFQYNIRNGFYGILRNRSKRHE